MFLVVAFVIFSLALFGVAWYVWAMPQQESERSLDARLRSVRGTASMSKERGATDLLHRERRGTFAFLGDFVGWLGILSRLQLRIQQANLPYRAADVTGVCAAAAILTYFLLSLLLPVPLLRLLFTLLVAVAPIVYISFKRSARLKKFETALPDAIDLFTRTMRAGHNIHSGLETIAQETSDPIRMEFRKVIEELALGSAIEPALHKLGERIPLLDLKFFITGLILQRQTGANMVAVLENLSTLVRERLNMAAKLKAHTAQQRFSAGLLCALPVVVGIGFWIQSEDTKLLWTDPLGIKLFTYATVSELTGILVIRKMSNIRV